MANESLESTKRTAADQIDSVAKALESARTRLEQEQPTLAAYAGRISTGVSNLATRLREGSTEELLEDARRLARRNPALFLAGGVALGFSLARFLKASAERSVNEYSSEGDYRLSPDRSSYASGTEGIASGDGGSASYSGPREDLGQTSGG
jgi:hypothetical protein